MLSITDALVRIKGRVADAVPEELIRRLGQEVGHRWRERDLGPVLTTHLFLQQVLHGNIAVGELRRLSGLSFTEAAYCQARGRLPRVLLERLQRAVTDTLFTTSAVRPTELWRGHRVFLLDGSGFSMPDTPALQAHFGQPGGQAEGCGFPVAHLLVRFDAATGLLLRTVALPLRSHDLSGVAAMHADLSPGDVLVGDRAFGSYAHLALCQQRGIHGVFRAHQKQIIDFRPHRRHATAHSRQQGQKGLPSSRWLKRLGKHDQLVEYVKPKERPAWLTEEQYAQLPASLVVREVRYTIADRTRRTRVVTLVTTLLDPEQYPAKELAKLYGLRLGCGDQSETPETDLEDGCVALSDGRGRAQGIGRIGADLQPGATRDLGSGTAAASSRGAHQLHRCLALAALCAAGRCPARLGGQPRAARQGGAPRTQAPAQAVPAHDATAGRTAQADVQEKGCGLT